MFGQRDPLHAFVRYYHSADELVVLVASTSRNYGAVIEKRRTNPTRERKRKGEREMDRDRKKLERHEDSFLALGFVLADDAYFLTFRRELAIRS